MTIYDNETTAISTAIKTLITHEADLVDVFRDDTDNAIYIVLRTDTDDHPEIMLKVC